MVPIDFSNKTFYRLSIVTIDKAAIYIRHVHCHTLAMTTTTDRQTDRQREHCSISATVLTLEPAAVFWRRLPAAVVFCIFYGCMADEIGFRHEIGFRQPYSRKICTFHFGFLRMSTSRDIGSGTIWSENVPQKCTTSTKTYRFGII